ncbi:hypothetical protein SAMN04515674_105281 [Pseudarcicella hirudinis]|uniref:Uncharacterized protein n=1 Tax=Pseudarcicella hirudinis TaxID=1079859 RepID=A0A1I5SZ15_9BACT|nr:hypothetical protein [Pseudarcicella hirudinis]SFP75871.1 hypothetical protein SAMN04515674_105281 [Pseudarcicella hirudinis]
MESRKKVKKDGGRDFSIENGSGKVTVNVNNPSPVTTNSTPWVDKFLRWIQVLSFLLKIYEVLI